MKTITTDRKEYEAQLTKEGIACTEVNITPGVSVVYSYELPDEVKITARKARK